MMRSLYSGVSGLRTHQYRMDVIGNNIANINTTGFKKSRTIFQDMLSQTLRAASAPTDANLGGMNAMQIGLGVSLGSIDVLHTQGAPASTGNNLDVMIQGDGYFIVQDSLEGDAQRFYTRAGNFAFDKEGNMVVTSTGMYVVGDGGEPITVDNIDEVKNLSIDAKGQIVYIDADNELVDDGPLISIATFANPMGLESVGQNMYMETNNSGDPQVDVANGEHGQGSIIPGSLEMSNVDLAEEFTDMIVTQRGHQANARTIRTSDEMLQELAQLKR